MAKKRRPSENDEIAPKPPKTELLATPIHGPYSFGLTPAAALAVVRPDRDAYPPLPLTVGELPGTTWVNVYTGNFITVQAIGYDRAGYPGPDPIHNILFSMGLWWTIAGEHRFIIEHWVQLDPADLALCYPWKLHSLKHYVEEYRRFLPCKGDRASGSNYDFALSHYQAALADALAYAAQHGLSQAEIYRLQAQAEGKPVQLGLF